MKLYKIKKEASHYFTVENKPRTKKKWQSLGVHEIALEPYKECSVVLGFKKENEEKTLAKWESSIGSEIYLTLGIENTTITDHGSIRQFVEMS